MEKLNRLFDVEFRSAEGEEASNKVIGTAAVIGQKTDMGWYEEVIEQGAFDGCDMSDVVLNLNHDDSILLAGTRNGSMRLWVDTYGLNHESEVIDTTQGKDALKLVRSGLISKMSFAFVIDRDGEEWEDRMEGKEIRHITKIKKLYDVSLVTFPAYPQTSVFARGAEGDDQLAQAHLKLVERRKAQDEKMKEILSKHGN